MIKILRQGTALILILLFFCPYAGASESVDNRKEFAPQPLNSTATSSNVESMQDKIDTLQTKVNELEWRLLNTENRFNNFKSGASMGLVSFLFGAFCALWAQNTRRNAFGWFIAGAIFNFIAVLFVLWYNSNDLNQPPYNV